MSDARAPRRNERAATTPVLVAIYLVILLGISLPTWFFTQQDRTLTLESEARNGLVAVRLLDEHASQILRDATRHLDRIADDAARDSGLDEGALRKRIGQARLADSSHLNALRFISTRGVAWVTSPDFPAHEVDVSAQEHVRLLLDHPEQADVAVGRAYPSPYDSQLVVPLARNVIDPTGRHLGIVSVDIRIAYFGELYARVAKDNNAAVALLASDGHVIVRSPFEARYFDRDVSASPVMLRLTSAPDEGVFEDPTFLDDEAARQYVYRRVAGHGIITLYAREIDDILRPWRQRSQERLLFAGATVLTLAILVTLLARYFSRMRGAQKSAEDSEARFAGLFRHSPVPLILSGAPDGRIIEVNEACTRQLGYSREEVVGQLSLSTRIWVDPGQRQALIDELVSHGRVDPTDVVLRHKDGRILTMSVSAAESPSGRQRMYVFTVNDVTQQRAVELEIRDLNQQLEQRVAARTLSLEQANHELSQALDSVKAMQAELIRSEKMSALGSLVAGVAHELNTPIGIGVTVASTLQSSAESMLADVEAGRVKRSVFMEQLAAFRNGVGILMRNLDRAANLVSSFKQVAVDQSGDVRRRFVLKSVLEELALTLEPLCRKPGHRLVLGEIPEIMMDSYPGALSQIITNFVSNSLMHGFEGRNHGTMQITVADAGNDWLAIEYTDDGAGIPAENLQRVFDPFFTTKLGQGGSGLGLHIVFNIVRDRLGGRIELKSAPGEGVRFTLTLPRVSPVRASTPTPVRDAP